MRKLFLLALLGLTLYADAHLFVYHRFGDDRHPSTNTSLEALKAQFEYFKKHNYEVITLDRLHKAYKNSEPIDDKWVVLTIDDNFKSFFENGLPMFKQYGYPFTLFVYTKATDAGYGDYMSWEQIKKASKYGEIGLHGHGHHHLVSLSDDDVKKDTSLAYESFKKELGYAPRYYAYPYGEYDAEVKKAIQSFGFDLIINQNSGAVNEQSDPFDLDRIALTGEAHLGGKLAIEALNVTWIEPKSWPENGNLKLIHAKIPENISSLEYYVSGHGWHRVKAKEGVVKVTTEHHLNKNRVRVFLKSGKKQSSTILVKE